MSTSWKTHCDVFEAMIVASVDGFVPVAYGKQSFERGKGGRPCISSSVG